MKLYTCAGARGLRATWTLDELGVDYELEALPFPSRKLVPWYREVNPLGTVPGVVDGELVMTESSAIAQ